MRKPTGNSAERRKADVAATLRRIPVFASIAEDSTRLDLLTRICRFQNFGKGSVVFHEGDVGSEMFVVFRGCVEIQKKTRAGDSYTVVVLRAEDNVFFGELALVDDDRRSATVIPREDSEFIVIEKNDFVALGDKYPEIGLPITRAIAAILASRLRKTTADMLTIFDALVNEIQS